MWTWTWYRVRNLGDLQCSGTDNTKYHKFATSKLPYLQHSLLGTSCHLFRQQTLPRHDKSTLLYNMEEPSARPIFPVEIWINIVQYVNDLDLWVIYRQVSRALRMEAEPEFDKTRLCNLTIHAVAQIVLYTDEHSTFSFRIATRDILEVRANRVKFKVEHHISQSLLGVRWDPEKERSLDEFKRRALSNPKLDYSLRT